MKESVWSRFGQDARVYLFGSRVDDSKRGGDIDLLVESSLDDDAAFRARLELLDALQSQLGDQKFDIVTTSFSSDETQASAIVSQARAQGVPL